MKKILCPTDFSETANNAISYAAAFAKQTEAEVTLFNVQSLFALSPGEMMNENPPTLEWAKEMLNNQAEEVTRTFHVPCHVQVRISDDSLATLMADYAADYDLIIMGSNGPDNLGQFFFGTNTYKVFRQSGIPLIIIPESIRFSSMKRIVLAYDMLHHGVPPLEGFNSWMQPLHPQLCFIQLSDRKLKKEEEEKLQHIENDLRNKVAQLDRVTVEVVVSNDYAHDLQQCMLRFDADLLVIFAHSYTLMETLFHKSLAKKLFHDSMYPILVEYEDPNSIKY